MEDVLPGLKVIITDGQTQQILPLESFSGTGTAAESPSGRTGGTGAGTAGAAAGNTSGAAGGITYGEGQ